MSTRIELDLNDLKQLFDLVCNSMDFGSGFLDGEDVVLLRRIASLIGVDPLLATPSTEMKHYPHPADTRWGGDDGKCWTCRLPLDHHLHFAHDAQPNAAGGAEGDQSNGASNG